MKFRQSVLLIQSLAADRLLVKGKNLIMIERKQRVVILGGGFGGVYTALNLEKALRGRDDFEITLFN